MRQHGLMELRAGLSIDDARLAEFAAQHGIRRLALFGSALRPDFASNSDIDLLVEFLAGRTPGLLRLAAMELELEAELGYPVELRTYEDLSTYFRHQVAATSRPLMRPEDRVRLAHLHDAASKAITPTAAARPVPIWMTTNYFVSH